MHTIDKTKEILNAELNRLDNYDNFQMLTKSNIKQFIVEPYEVTVNSDNLQVDDKNMWVVLKLNRNSLIAIDVLEKEWFVLHPLQGGGFICSNGEETLVDALDAM